MALMQEIPSFKLASGAYQSSTPVPRVAPPQRVAFRSGGDLGAVVEAVKANKRVAVDAAPGAGKSTALPAALARETSKLVVQVEPFPRLAQSVHAYVVGVEKTVPVRLMVGVDDPWPEQGVVLLSAGLLVARWLQAGRVSLPQCYLLHDESHESGAASAAVRDLTVLAPELLSYVMMTATSGPSGVRRMETGGEVLDSVFEPAAFADPWSVEESGAPWACESLDGHVLLFEDDMSRADALVQAYSLNGFKAFRLHAKSSAAAFDRVSSALAGAASPYLVAVVADSTYRSGYTFPVSTIVDSGKVRRVVVQDGKPVWRERRLYACEVAQSRARGGRVVGQRTAYWKPVGKYEEKICDLEQTDAEALAAICRALGYAPPACARVARMATGPVPRDLSGALRGVVPLAALPATALKEVESAESVHESRAAREASPAGGDGSAEDVRVSYPRETSVDASSELRSGESLPLDGQVGTGETNVLQGAVDSLRLMLDEGGSQAEGRFGEYLCATGVVTADVTSFAFPEGGASVRRAMEADDSRTVHYGWSLTARSVAANALLHSYNLDMLEMRAYSGALRELRAGSQRSARKARAWAVTAAERMSQLGTRAERSLCLARAVSADVFAIVACGNLFAEEEGAMTTLVKQDYEVSVPTVVDVRGDELRRVRGWTQRVGEVPASPAVAFADVVAGVGEVREMPRVARGHTGYVVPRYVTTCLSSGGSSSASSSGSGKVVHEKRHGKGYLVRHR